MAGRTVVVGFDGGEITSDAGALLLGRVDQSIGLIDRAIESLFVDLFLDAHSQAPAAITLDLDATDDPLYGTQEGRFFHGYYDAYCYLPLYVFCGKHLLVAKLRQSNIDGSAGSVEEIERVVTQIRSRWPQVRITLRADSGFARDELMAWCKANTVDLLFVSSANICPDAAIRASSSPRCRRPSLMHVRCTRMCTARAAKWKTGSRSARPNSQTPLRRIMAR